MAATLQIEFAKAKNDLSGNYARGFILCDSVSDLPTINAFTGYTLVQGSKAHVIDVNQDYMLSSDGTWYPYGGEMWQNVYTKMEIDALLEGKQDELSFDAIPISGSTNPVKSGGVWDPLDILIQDGAKNRAALMSDSLTYNNVVFTVDRAAGTITISTTGGTAVAYKAFRFLGDMNNTGWQYGIPIPKGTYIISGLPDGASYSGVRYILGISLSQNEARTTVQIYDGDYTLAVNNDTTRIDLAAYVPTGQDLDTPFVFRPSIVDTRYIDISNEFMPYAPTNRELYEMILALQ